MSFIEHTVQNAAIEWLGNLGYSHREGNSIERDLKKVVLEDALLAFLTMIYKHIPHDVLVDAMRTFLTQESMDLDQRNREFHVKLTQGIDITWKDKAGKEYAEHVYPVDFAHPENNTFICVDELSIIGKNNRRTDLIIYVNGLPLILFEFKNMFDASVGVENAYNQIQHYKLDIPELFVYNAITILSDGTQTLHGMYSSDIQWYAPWKSREGDDIENKIELQLETIIQGLFPKKTLLSYLQNYIFHEDHNSKIIKKGAKYHQYWGITKAVASAKRNLQPLGDGKIGVIWHTQGSGKSISMAILTGILRQLPAMKNPTLVIQVDRAALDQQLYDNFILAKDLVGNVSHADSTDDLRDLLSTDGGGVIFTTIEKFRLKDTEQGKESQHPILSERYNVIVMADEAHRTQYGFNDGGYAQNLRIALPNASFIGFTGTPVDSQDQDTQLVFGPTIHAYDIKQAVIDGATVPIHYEPKMVPLSIKGEFAGALEAVVQEEDDKNTVWAALEDAAGAPERVKKVATNIVQHFKKRTDSLAGKGMVVCMSRRNCVKVYDALVAQDGCPEVAVIMTSNISKDPKEWNPHVRTSSQMEAIKQRFKDPEDPLSLVIVRDMWLTGFDAPCCHTMYVDKIMKGHNLMQAIARVNRVFKGKKNGLVVDFIGISNMLAEATKKYTTGGGKGKPTIDIDEVVELCLEQFNEVKSLLDDFTLEEVMEMSDGDKTKWFNDLLNRLLSSDPVTDHFLQEEMKLKELVSMCNSDPRIWPIQEEVAIIQKFRQSIRKVKYPPGKSREKNNNIKDLIGKALESQKIVNLAEMYDLEDIDISIIDSQFQAIAKEKGEENIKIELLRRIINDELRVKAMSNISKMTNLKEELEKVLSNYHKNSLDSIAAIKHLLDIAEELQNESKRAHELGLADDELAFYDLLVTNKDILNVDGPIQELVHKVVKSLKKNLHLDWTKKESAKAAIRIEIKRELRGVVPFSELDNVLKAVIEQAEGQYSDWPMTG